MIINGINRQQKLILSDRLEKLSILNRNKKLSSWIIDVIKKNIRFNGLFEKCINGNMLNIASKLMDLSGIDIVYLNNGDVHVYKKKKLIGAFFDYNEIGGI